MERMEEVTTALLENRCFMGFKPIEEEEKDGVCGDNKDEVIEQHT